MNYNANTGARQALGKKVKRVSDLNAMGYNPYNQPPPTYTPNEGNFEAAGYSYNPNEFGNQGMQPQPQFNAPNELPPAYAPNVYMNAPRQPQLPGMFAQPIVQDMAMQYGQQIANTGKTMVKQGLEQYVHISKLKYYFAVDTKYVVSKLGLLFFPFLQKDWSVKYEQDGSPVQPRFELNAPDLYIPTMAYVTYVLVAGLVLGMQQRFSPEQIGIQASSALAWCIFELVIYSCTLYIMNIQTSLKTSDLLAFIGYKFVGIIASILVSLIAARLGYYLALSYVSFALAFFLIRTLKAQVLPESSQQTQYYGDGPPTAGNKRRLYFLLFVAIAQPVLSWWLSFHLIGLEPPSAAKPI